MKYSFLILLFAGILFQTVTKTIVFFEYVLNQDYIAKNLCVQKEVEDNECHGTCHLKSQLEKTEESPEKDLKFLKDKSEPVLFCISTLVKISVTNEEREKFFHDEKRLNKPYQHLPIKPPRA